MKKNTLCILFTLLILTACSSEKKEIQIEGRIIGNLPKRISYTNPINGICDFAFQSKALVDSTGYFKITESIDRPTIIKIYYSRLVCFVIVAEPGKQYDLVIDTKKDKLFFTDASDSKELQVAYNSLEQIHPLTCTYNFDEGIENIKTQLKLQLQKDNAVIENLYSKKKINQNIKQFLTLDRKVRSSILMSYAANKEIITSLQRDEPIDKSAKELWENAIINIDLNEREFLSTSDACAFLDYYLKFDLYTENYKEYKSNRKIYSDKGLKYTFFIDDANNRLSPKLAEYYTAHYINKKLKQRKPVTEFSMMANSFSKKYPHSKLLIYFEKITNE